MKIFLILLLFSLSSALPLLAETLPPNNLKEYDVEIIIFEDAHARYLSSQSWEQPLHNADASDITETTKHSNDINSHTINFESIKPFILTSNYKKINASSEYNVLFYGAWRQAGLDKTKAFEINIDELKNNHKNRSKNVLSGNFKLVLARYLHMYTEIDYIRKKPAVVKDETTEITRNNNGIYQLSNHRRMRSKELHYVDHPLVGILLQINPVKKIVEEKPL